MAWLCESGSENFSTTFNVAVCFVGQTTQVGFTNKEHWGAKYTECLTHTSRTYNAGRSYIIIIIIAIIIIIIIIVTVIIIFINIIIIVVILILIVITRMV